MLNRHRHIVLSILLLLLQQQSWQTTAAPTGTTAAPAPKTAASMSTSVTTTKPLLSASPADQKASSSEEDGSTAPDKSTSAAPATTAGNGNVYGADNTATADQGAAGGKPRGYNQGYSYNTGIKPYRTGYTYFQPFGDAADQAKNGGGAAAPGGGGAVAAPQTTATGAKAGGAGAPPPPLPVELPNFFGLDPKTMGPMRVIPNQQVPVDENGIPNLDAIQIPQNDGEKGAAVAPVVAPPAAPAINPAVQTTAQNLNPQDFTMGNDFNLNQILGGGGAAQPVQQPVQQQFASNPANDNSMFDFAPPAAQNFDLPTNGGSNDGRDYNRLDNFAGNLNNFDTYLGDGSLPMIGAGNTGGGGGGNGGGGGLGDGFGFGDGGNGNNGGGGNQAVPSEIANLNNAFGANTNQASNNDMINILNQLNGGAQPQQQQPGGNEMDFGNFGNAATNRNQFFPFF